MSTKKEVIRAKVFCMDNPGSLNPFVRLCDVNVFRSDTKGRAIELPSESASQKMHFRGPDLFHIPVAQDTDPVGKGHG